MLKARSWLLLSVALTTLLACGNGTSIPGQSASADGGSIRVDGGDEVVDAGSTAVDGGNAQDGGSRADGGAENSIAGSVNGRTFNTAAVAYWIGMPDSSATTVVYVFDRAVNCADLSSQAWDTRIPNHTQVLEMKMIGTTIGNYPVTTRLTPGPGKSSVNYTLSAIPDAGTPTENITNAGSVTLSDLVTTMRATGSFDLTFASGTLTGSFNATWCPGGNEP